ncbi:hypothetical protein TWF481_004560 [Arthrobotrys musiformis]|uniref:Uncharacterized protein n=1 Tax=Arthrobotrys musiformis TaxID=47236 RepID=A0AAV9WJX8_9PEZI
MSNPQTNTESNQQDIPDRGPGANRPRRHSDPLGKVPRHLLVAHNDPATGYTGPAANLDTYMRVMAEVESALIVASSGTGQKLPSTVDEISVLLQNCHFAEVSSADVDTGINHAFLMHFDLPISDWSLGLVSDARRTRNFRALTRVVAVLDNSFGPPIDETPT